MLGHVSIHHLLLVSNMHCRCYFYVQLVHNTPVASLLVFPFFLAIHSPSLFTPSPAVAMGNHKVHSDPFTPSPAVAMGNHKAYSDLFTSWRNTTFAEAPTSMTTIQAPLSPDLFPCTPARGTQSKGFSTPVWWMSPDIL